MRGLCFYARNYCRICIEICGSKMPQITTRFTTFYYRDMPNYATFCHERGISVTNEHAPETLQNAAYRGITAYTETMIKVLFVCHGNICRSPMAEFVLKDNENNIRNTLRITGGDPDNKISLLLDYTDRAGQQVADPWYTGNFDATWRDVTEGCEGLLKKLT